MANNTTTSALLERARENLKALKMASRQHAFKEIREEILIDLQLAEIALAALESNNAQPAEPVLWKIRLIDIKTGMPAGEWKYTEQCPPSEPGAQYRFEAVPFYTAPPAAAQVPDEKCDADGSTTSEFDSGWNACRAAMLQGAEQPQNAQQNIPGGLVEAVNRLLNYDGSRGCYSAMECGAAREKIELWLAQRKKWEAQRTANLKWEAQRTTGNSPAIPDGWIPCSERMPDNASLVLCFGQYGDDGGYEDKYRFIGYFCARHGLWRESQGESAYVTHWMPLPEDPATQEDGQ